MKALLILNDNLVDISGMVQTITALENGEVAARGNGIIVGRPNHIHGDAPIFLARQGVDYLLGQKVTVFTIAKNWTMWDYDKYEMVGENASKSVVMGNHKLKVLRDSQAIL